jgi:uncharacterized protein YyaL (SSP411 family)
VQQAGLPLARAQQLLGECRRQLFDVRAGRPRPSLDDKVGRAPHIVLSLTAANTLLFMKVLQAACL